MKKTIILTLLSIVICRVGFGYQAPPFYQTQAPFSTVEVKKTINGAICDSCKVDNFLHAEPEFTYVVIGTGHTPSRFSPLLQKVKAAYANNGLNTAIHLISTKEIDLTFLPNRTGPTHKLLQLYRNFGGQDYQNLEYEAQQNGQIIKEWTQLSTLGGVKDHVIFGSKMIGDETVSVRWPQTYHAGKFSLAVNDTLKVVVRNINTKRVVKAIVIIRAEDKATNFFYCQLKLKGDNLSSNLQSIINTIEPLNVSYGDTTNTFQKDDQAIGLLRFNLLGPNERLEYSFDKAADNWQSVLSDNPEMGTFIVLGNELPAGKHQNVYLRYASQPETVHKITVLVKPKPFQMPWGLIALVSIVLLITVGVVSYTLHFKNKIKLALLKQKNDDTETRLSLLNGQLNPHFLYNSLNAIQGTINSDNPEKANTYIANVAAFMRNVMDSGKKEFVSLQEELNLEEDYLKLEQQRANFTYNINVAPGLDAGQIDFPPLLLQPVLENSIRHAFNTEQANPAIGININKNGHDLLVELTDNGSTAWDVERAQPGHGLSLTKKRMAIYNDKLDAMHIQMQLKYQAKTGTVTTFTFKNWLA